MTTMRRLNVTISTPDGEELSVTEIEVPHEIRSLNIEWEDGGPSAEIDISFLGTTEL